MVVCFKFQFLSHMSTFWPITWGFLMEMNIRSNNLRFEGNFNIYWHKNQLSYRFTCFISTFISSFNNLLCSACLYTSKNKYNNVVYICFLNHVCCLTRQFLKRSLFNINIATYFSFDRTWWWLFQKRVVCTKLISKFLFSETKDLYSRKDMNLVFSCFISHGEVLCYNRAKLNSFNLKCLENS